MPKSDEEALKDYFIKRLKLGDKLTTKDLIKYVKKRKLKVKNEFVKNLKGNVLESALYLQLKPMKHFQTITVPKVGLLSIDFAYYGEKEFWGLNKGNKGFLMVTSVTPGKRWALSMRGRDTKNFEKALEELILANNFPAINTILSDREKTVFSINFQNSMYEKYNIKFSFLHLYNKAWSAENAINHTKTTLSAVYRLNKTHRWINLLQEVINTHNRQKIEHTSFTPIDIDDSNFQEFLNELYRTDDYSLTYNTNSIDSRSILNKDWLNKLFKFKVGQKVLVARYSLRGRKAFEKSRKHIL